MGYNTAISIIRGQNIGTCVTAMISSVGASRNARGRMRDKGVRFSEKALQELEVLRRAIRDILQIAMGSFFQKNLELAR